MLAGRESMTAHKLENVAQYVLMFFDRDDQRMHEAIDRFAGFSAEQPDRTGRRWMEDRSATAWRLYVPCVASSDATPRTTTKAQTPPRSVRQLDHDPTSPRSANMAVEGDDLTTAAETIAKEIRLGLGGYDSGELNSTHGVGNSVAGGLFAIATALNRIADAIEMSAQE
jgi:hypothetical protein